jgi:hypothetical protein
MARFHRRALMILSTMASSRLRRLTDGLDQMDEATQLSTWSRPPAD